MSKFTNRIPTDPRLVTVRVDSPAELERTLREFAGQVVIAGGDGRERHFAEASAVHQRLLALRLLAA
jgi:hypothetical protein